VLHQYVGGIFFFVVVTYMENAAPIYVFSGLTITSIETDYLMSATVELVAEVSLYCVHTLFTAIVIL